MHRTHVSGKLGPGTHNAQVDCIREFLCRREREKRFGGRAVKLPIGVVAVGEDGLSRPSPWLFSRELRQTLRQQFPRRLRIALEELRRRAGEEAVAPGVHIGGDAVASDAG